MNTLFTNGVIAVREKSLLGEKLLRFAEMSAEEVFRALSESGFGSGSDAASVHDGEQLCEAESAELDGFIREYAPSRAIAEYLLLPRDYHNAKALVKAEILHTGFEKLLAPAGLVPVGTLSDAIGTGEFEPLGALGETMRSVLSMENPTGAEVGFAFDKALFSRLLTVCRHNSLLRRLLAGRADRLNILTVLRAPDEAFAEKFLLPGGKCDKETLLSGEFKDPSLAEFYRMTSSAKEKGQPFTEAERAVDSFEAEYFTARKYELEGKEPFLYYVFRRRAEISDVRILLVCLNAGLDESEIKKRLRAIG